MIPGGPAPAAARPNFNPDPSNPWANPTQRDVGDWWTHSPGSDEFFGDRRGNQDRRGDLWATDAWANPLDGLSSTLFGRQMPVHPDMLPGAPANLGQMPTTTGYAEGVAPGTDPNLAAAQQTLFGSGSETPVVNTGQRYLGPGMVIGPDGRPMKDPNATPLTTKDLYDKIGGLQLDQLLKIRGGAEGLSSAFGKAALNYSNAYANPNYGKRIFGQQENFGANPLGKAESMDWLQKSYNDLLKKLDDAYLL